MARKIIFLAIIILILLGGGIFYWWQNQADVRELNKTLPKGIWVEKNLFGLGNEYWVKNKIDGYEFGVPGEWEGVKEINYIPKATGEQHDVASINVMGLSGEARFVAIDKFKVEDNLTLENWAQKIFDNYKLSGNFIRDRVGIIDIVKTQENTHLAGMYVYFLREKSSIYSLTGGSEQFIKEIIISGKW